MRGVGERSIGVACMSPIGAHPQRVVSPTKIRVIDKISPQSSPTAHDEILCVVHLCDVQYHCVSSNCAIGGNLANYFGVCKITLTEYA